MDKGAKTTAGTRPSNRVTRFVTPIVLGLLIVAVFHRDKLHSNVYFPGIVQGASHIYELPTSRVHGVVLFLHGCGHSAKDYWPRSLVCRDCLGLPSEVLLVAEARRQGYVALAVTSSDRASGCWHPGGEHATQDRARIADALRGVQDALDGAGGRDAVLRNVVVQGISSGGRFASTLPQDETLGARVSALILQVSALDASWAGGLSPSRPRFPPVAFVAMSRDEDTLSAVRRDMTALSAAGVRTTRYIAKPKAIAEAYCASQLGEPHRSACAELVAQLGALGYLDDGGLLAADPRRNPWRNALAPLAARLGDALVPDQSPLAQFLHTAYARHEATAEFARASLAFAARHRDARRAPPPPLAPPPAHTAP